MTFATKKQRNCNITRFATKKRVKPWPIEINVNNVTSIATVYWCIKVDSTFVYLGPLDFNKDSNNHICCRQMLYKGLVIIITALFSDCKTFGKIFRISAIETPKAQKFWVNSEILSFVEPLIHDRHYIVTLHGEMGTLKKKGDPKTDKGPRAPKWGPTWPQCIW